eukprot:2270_1
MIKLETLPHGDKMVENEIEKNDNNVKRKVITSNSIVLDNKMVENELNKENKSKHELQQLLYDTKSIIDNISKHENDSNLVNTLKNNFVTIEATLSNSTKHKKRINKISLRTSNDLLPNDIANIGQTRIEKINTIKSQFDNDNEIKSSKPWKPNDQHCIKRYFQLNCDKNINKEINEIKPLSPSLNYINKIEKEINEIHNKIKHKHKEIEEIEIVGIDIPLNQYYLKDAVYKSIFGIWLSLFPGV